MPPICSPYELPPLPFRARLEEFNLAGGRLENEGSSFELFGRCVGEILGIPASLGLGFIPRSSGKLQVLTIGHFSSVDPEPIDGDLMDRFFLGIFRPGFIEFMV